MSLPAVPWVLIVRNLWRNRKSNAAAALLVAVISFLFFAGNSIIARTLQSMKETYIDGATGDAVIEAAGDVTMNLFGANIAVIDDYFVIPELPAYRELERIAREEPRVAGMTRQVSARAYFEVKGYREPLVVSGVDPATYFALFPSIELQEGRFIGEGEYGVMITGEKARKIEKATGAFPSPGTKALLTTGGSAGFKIREAPITGIFRYKNAAQYLNDVVLTDPQTARILASVQVAAENAETGEEAASLFGAGGIDDLFGGDEALEAEEADEGLSPDSVRDFLRANKAAAPAAEGGGWNFILLRLKDSVFPSRASVIASLDKRLRPFGAAAVNWQTAAGETATMLLLLQALFNSGITLVSLTGVIVIINANLITVFRRKREIGALRSIGAGDGYIRALFLGECVLLSLAAGAAGVALGALCFRAVNALEFTVPNALVRSLLGGGALRFEFSARSAAVSLALAVAVGAAAAVYPVETAVRVEPVEALRDSL